MSKRTALIATGAVLTAAGAAVATGGVALAAFAGTDGTVSTGHHGVTSTTTALISADGDVDGGDTGPFDAPTLSVQRRGLRQAGVRRHRAGRRTSTATWRAPRSRP